jgi:hypothetical protein
MGLLNTLQSCNTALEVVVESWTLHPRRQPRMLDQQR